MKIVQQQNANPYHMYEFTRPEFRALLENRFAHVVMYSQRFTNPAYYRARNLRLAATLIRKLLPLNSFRNLASCLENRATRTYEWMKQASLEDVSIVQDRNGGYLIAVCQD